MFTFDEAVEKLKHKPNYQDIYKIIFQWVKNSKINPDTMQKLIVYHWKIYCH